MARLFIRAACYEVNGLFKKGRRELITDEESDKLLKINRSGVLLESFPNMRSVRCRIDKERKL